MRTVQIQDQSKYGKAFAHLLKRGATFYTKPTVRLVVSDADYKALVKARLVASDRAMGRNSGKASKKSKAKV